MANGAPLRPCTYCGGGEFIHLPEVAIQLDKVVSMMGVTGTQTVKPYPRVSMLICSSCGRTEWFASHLQQMYQAFPGAQVLRAG